MKWYELVENLRCPRKGCRGKLKIPRLRAGQYFTGHVDDNSRELDVRCLRCQLRFIVTNPNSTLSEEYLKEKEDGKRQSKRPSGLPDPGNDDVGQRPEVSVP